MKPLNINFFSHAHREYFASMVEAIRSFYGEDLIALAIFGSMARGANRLNSDCDVLIILKYCDRSRLERLRDFTVIEQPLRELERACFASGVQMEISPLILTKDEASFFNPLYLDMVESVVILVDREQFLRRTIESVRQKMVRWGSRKEDVGNGYLWRIQPNAKWNDLIDYDS